MSVQRPLVDPQRRRFEELVLQAVVDLDLGGPADRRHRDERDADGHPSPARPRHNLRQHRQHAVQSIPPRPDDGRSGDQRSQRRNKRELQNQGADDPERGQDAERLERQNQGADDPERGQDAERLERLQVEHDQRGETGCRDQTGRDHHRGHFRRRFHHGAAVVTARGQLLVIPFENLDRMARGDGHNQNRGHGVEGIHRDPKEPHEAERPDDGHERGQQGKRHALEASERPIQDEHHHDQGDRKQVHDPFRIGLQIGERDRHPPEVDLHVVARIAGRHIQEGETDLLVPHPESIGSLDGAPPPAQPRFALPLSFQSSGLLSHPPPAFFGPS